MKKIEKRVDKIFDLLFKNGKKLAKYTKGKRYCFSSDVKIDEENVIHLLIKFDFPIKKIKLEK